MCRLGEKLIRILVLIATVASPAVVAAATCPGDCDRDVHASLSELLLGINIALGNEPLSHCPSSDVDESETVTVDELVEIVHAVLYGCFATPRPLPTATLTPRPNRSPRLETLPLFRLYPHEEMRFVVPASDLDGDKLRYVGNGLPAGATLTEDTGELRWIPGADQVGVFSIALRVIDDGRPPLAIEDVLRVVVFPLDGCVVPDCDPAAGCSSTLPDADDLCCLPDPLPRVFEPVAPCIDEPTTHLGRNNVGFGRLQNCDELRVREFSQGGAAVLFHVEASCLNTSEPVIVRSVMDSTRRFLFDDEQNLELEERGDGFAEYRFLRIPISGRGPFTDLEGQEANLTVTLTDVDGVRAEKTVRLRLTFDRLPDLP